MGGCFEHMDHVIEGVNKGLVLEDEHFALGLRKGEHEAEVVQDDEVQDVVILRDFEVVYSALVGVKFDLMHPVV